jgi:hypothetical protein
LTGQVEKSTFSSDILEGVRAMGLKVQVLSRADASPGFWVGIQVGQKTHRLTGGVSQGLEGQVVSY